MSANVNTTEVQFVALMKKNGLTQLVKRSEVWDLCTSKKVKWPHWLTSSENRASRGVFRVPDQFWGEKIVDPKPEIVKPESPSSPVPQPSAMIRIIDSEDSQKSLIPSVNPRFIPWGHHNKIVKIFKSKKFLPIFIPGSTGNGKTFGNIQACAYAKREVIRVNITKETCEDDLLGGFRIVDNATVWFNGPVIDAMQRGAVLLLDELDLASAQIMCLQPVLEGNGIFIKKISKWVTPTPGFTVIATGNTKGRGDAESRYFGVNFLNEALLERFAMTLEQEYPPAHVEKNIINTFLEVEQSWILKKEGSTEIINALVDWSQLSRKAYADAVCSDQITTRRLVDIVRVWDILGNVVNAIEDCTARFDRDNAQQFVSSFKKMVDLDKNASASLDPVDSASGAVAITPSGSFNLPFAKPVANSIT